MTTQAIFFFFPFSFYAFSEFPTCKQSQWLAVSQESRCKWWDVLEPRFCHAARENAWGASGEVDIDDIRSAHRRVFLSFISRC